MKYKLVPVEPTVEMLWRKDAPFAPWRKCSDCGAETGTSKNNQREFYKAMLAAAPSPEWVPVSERLPTLDDSDDGGIVWVWDGREVQAVGYYDVGCVGVYPAETHWMPKPRQQPPAPPTAAPAQPPSADHTPQAPAAEPGSK